MCINIGLAQMYDSVRWDFLKATLHCMRFPPHIIKVIVACVVDPQFSVLVNCSFEGYFISTRRLKKGCPLSLIILAKVMEFFSNMISIYDSSNLIPTPFKG